MWMLRVSDKKHNGEIHSPVDMETETGSHNKSEKHTKRMTESPNLDCPRISPACRVDWNRTKDWLRSDSDSLVALFISVSERCTSETCKTWFLSHNTPSLKD